MKSPLRIQKSSPSLLLYLTMMVSMLSACSSVSPPSASDKSSSNTPALLSLPLNALPTGARILNEQTLIMGNAENWFGRVVLDIGNDSESAFRFFLDQYPKQGWTLLSSTRSQLSLLIFSKNDRTATVQIQDNSVLLPGKVILNITPNFAAPVTGGNK